MEEEKMSEIPGDVKSGHLAQKILYPFWSDDTTSDDTANQKEPYRYVIDRELQQDELMGACHRTLAEDLYDEIWKWVILLKKQIAAAGEEITGSSLRLSARYESEEAPWRGVFTMSYPRKTIFSKEVKIHTSALPRWKPRITIDRRTLESEDD
jgi:hypothetical protein